MTFIADNIYANENIVTLKDIKWVDGDLHRFPSAEGTPDFNAVTNQYSFKLKMLK